jgi:hypothetical protein
MNQKSPLLNYRVVCEQNNNIPKNIKYDFITGLWQGKAGKTIIEQYIISDNKAIGQTIQTFTREGIDKSESAQNNDAFDKTSITETRESIDRCEVSLLHDNNIFGETILTKTREGTDRSEISCSDVSCVLFQSIETCTREAIDRSEKS